MSILTNKRQCLWLSFWLIGGLTGCQTYQKQTFSPQDFLNLVAEERQQAVSPQVEVLTFKQAAEMMSSLNYDLKILQKEYEKVQKISDLGTPWPNPEVEFGPTTRFDMAEAGKRTTPFAAIGFSIPLGGRIGKENSLKKQLALQAWEELLLGHRQLYQELRKAYITFSLKQARMKTMQEVNQMAQTSAELLRKLEKMGEVGALDVYKGLEEASQSQLEMLKIKEEQSEARAGLAVLLGCQLQTLATISLEKLPDLKMNLPSENDLQQLMLKNNPELIRIESEKNIFDAEYRLELAKQIPDLKLGLDTDQELDKTRGLSLSFGFEIPLFDRNQIAITEAKFKRDATELRYKGQLISNLTQIERLIEHYTYAEQKNNLIEKDLLPKAKKALVMAEKGVRTGNFSAIEWLKFQREYGDLLLIHTELSEQRWNIILELERLVGFPLVTFQDEKEMLLFDKNTKEKGE